MKKTVIAGVTVLVMNILLLVTVVSLTFHHYNLSTTTSSNTQTDPDQSVVKAQMIQLFDSVPNADAYRRDLAFIYQREGSLKKPAAHCLLRPGFSLTDDLPVLHWTCGGNVTTFKGKDVIYLDGSLVTATGAYYYVYSQITYREIGLKELNYGRIIHKVQKQWPLYKPSTTLMQQNLTMRRGRLAYTTSSLGATFYLEPGARISVESSIPRNIETVESPYSTTFGLFLV